MSNRKETKVILSNGRIILYNISCHHIFSLLDIDERKFKYQKPYKSHKEVSIRGKI
jgi:hypothetical protein